MGRPFGQLPSLNEPKKGVPVRLVHFSKLPAAELAGLASHRPKATLGLRPESGGNVPLTCRLAANDGQPRHHKMRGDCALSIRRWQSGVCRTTVQYEIAPQEIPR